MKKNLWWYLILRGMFALVLGAFALFWPSLSISVLVTVVGVFCLVDGGIGLAFALRELEVESLPVNFLHRIGGTPFEDGDTIAPQRALKALCLFRFTNPRSDIRAAGGRERSLGAWQSLALYPANSVPMLVERINNALVRADQIEHAAGLLEQTRGRMQALPTTHDTVYVLIHVASSLERLAAVSPER